MRGFNSRQAHIKRTVSCIYFFLMKSSGLEMIDNVIAASRPLLCRC